MKTSRVVLNLLSIVIFVCLTISNLVGQNNDSLNLEKESQHFNFYSTNGDIKVLDSLAITLENNYSRITNHLGIQIDKKINVKVFPNIRTFHVAINYPDAPDWVVGSCNGDELMMVSPLNPGSVHNYESLMQVIVHEFVHIAVSYARGDKGWTTLPRWLNEGYAQYEAGQINDHIRKIVKSSVMAKTPPTWSQLDTVSIMEFGNMNGYGLSVTIVEFLVDTYGIDKLVLLIKEPENSEIIYGLPKYNLEKQWIQYLSTIDSHSGSASKVQTQKSMTAKQITVRDKHVEINYFQQGKGDTTLLFLHGWCIDGTYWENQVDYFSKNYNVYAIDLPGFGKSNAERTNWTVEEYANDVTAFIDAMNLKNVVIIGHSMAGEIMLQLALSNNSKIVGIVGVDNFKFIDFSFTPEQMKQMTDFFPRLEKDFKNSAPEYADMILFHPTTSKEVKDRVKTDIANTDSAIGYGIFMNQMHYAYTDAQRLEQLNYKLYLINSDGFPTNEIGLKNHCKSSFQVQTIAATGHYPMIEKPAEFNLILENVLTSMK